MNLAQYAEYIGASMAKGTIGSQISIGIFVLIGIYAILGTYFGVIRGFSKSVIRLFTVGASAVCSLFLVMGVSRMIVKNATASGSAQTVDGLLNSYFPGLVDSMPDMVKPILSEMDAETATIFVMMLVAIIITPILFIIFFYLLKILTLFLYELLAGLSGAISYGRSVASMIGGGVVGLLQGIGIAAVIIIPISGLCNVAAEAREPLIGSSEEPNAYIEQAYDLVIDDLADNPVFDLVDTFGGSVAYEKMITVYINDEKKDMGDECVDAVKVLSNLLPFINADSDFDWKHPSDTYRQALTDTVDDIGDNELLASLVSDVIRGVAKSAQNGSLPINLSGSTKHLMDSALDMLSTCTRDTIQGDLDLVADVYFILCDHALFDVLSSGDSEQTRHSLTDKDADGNSAASDLIDRLDEYDRSHPIVEALSEMVVDMMLGGDEDSKEVYEEVKKGMSEVLSNKKSDFETEEEYKQAVYEDLDTTLTNNNITLDEETKQGMVDYIAENYGDHEGEITDKEIHDALLSYLEVYSGSSNNGEGGIEGLPDIPGITIPEGGSEDVPGEGAGE